jgi:hypothetical protein
MLQLPLKSGLPFGNRSSAGCALADTVASTNTSTSIGTPAT